MPRARDDRSQTASEAAWDTPGRATDASPPGPFDLIVCAGLVIVAAGAAFGLSEGDWLRFALTLPMVFFVPGYLLLQAAVRTSTRKTRVQHGLLSIGLSPAIIGILALATSLVPGAFRSGIIIGVVSAGALALAAAAWYRRSTVGLPRAAGRPTTQPVPDEAD